MQAAAMIVLLTSLAFATAGISGYLIFGPLAARHLRERHPAAASVGGAFSPGFFGFLLRGRYRALGDPSLSGLATPARLLGYSTIAGLVGVAATVGALP